MHIQPSRGRRVIKKSVDNDDCTNQNHFAQSMFMMGMRGRRLKHKNIQYDEPETGIVFEHDQLDEREIEREWKYKSKR